MSLLATAFLFAGCGPEPRRAEWSFRFASAELAGEAVRVEARIVEGGCLGTRDVYLAELAAGSEPTVVPSPPLLAPGRYGLRGRARDRECRWFASGCTDATFPAADGSSFDVPLHASGPQLACARSECDRGACAAADAGAPLDAGLDAIDPPDAPILDAPPLLDVPRIDSGPIVCEPALPSVSAGTSDFDLCGAGDDDAPRRIGDCDLGADGEDLRLHWTVAASQRFRIELQDADASAAVDPIVYIRPEACDGSGATLFCDDDIEIGRLLDASLEVELDPGAYVLVIDSYEYTNDGTTYRCGTVRLIVTPL